MVPVAAGAYTMGCDEEKSRRCFEDAKQHQVPVPSFGIMRHEVTVTEYQRCVAAEACPPPGQEGGCTGLDEDQADRPITCVDWAAADQYCKYVGWRLPTETEWEVAARGPDLPDYPWGSEPPSCKLTVMKDEEGGGCGAGGPLPVGSRPTDRSWAGALDMGGSVREWTASDYEAYPGGEVFEGLSGKVTRGGSWRMKGDELTTSHGRDVDKADESRPDLGFRCAVTR